MAKNSETTKLSQIILFTLTLIISTTLTTSKPRQFSETQTPQSLNLEKQKLTHLHFYFHDIPTGKNPTAVPVARAPTTNTSSSFFGLLVMMDEPLTLKPELTSKLVGKAQGIYASASQSEVSFLMAFNFVFSEGKYNGSSLSVLGRNCINSGVREMPVIGGSGAFRFARGYAKAQTHTADFKTGAAVVEYDVYVFHY